jgi:hypothetical protein
VDRPEDLRRAADRRTFAERVARVNADYIRVGLVPHRMRMAPEHEVREGGHFFMARGGGMYQLVGDEEITFEERSMPLSGTPIIPQPALAMVREMLGASLLEYAPDAIKFKSRLLPEVVYVTHGTGSILVAHPGYQDVMGLDFRPGEHQHWPNLFLRAAAFTAAIWLDELTVAGIACGSAGRWVRMYGQQLRLYEHGKPACNLCNPGQGCNDVPPYRGNR